MDTDEFRNVVYEDVCKLAKANKLNSLETPKQFFVKKDLFTIENDLLTPTMKLKRNIARAVYKEDIEKLYSMPVLTVKK